MLSNKKPGVISCHQESKNGLLEYSSELPRECRLSKGLKSQITPILQGLLETNPQRIITFEDFFSKMRKIASTKVKRISFTKLLFFHNIAQQSLFSFDKLFIYEDTAFSSSF